MAKHWHRNQGDRGDLNPHGSGFRVVIWCKRKIVDSAYFGTHHGTALARARTRVLGGLSSPTVLEGIYCISELRMETLCKAT